MNWRVHIQISEVTEHLTLESRLNLLKDSAQPEGVPERTNLFGYRF